MKKKYEKQYILRNPHEREREREKERERERERDLGT